MLKMTADRKNSLSRAVLRPVFWAVIWLLPAAVFGMPIIESDFFADLDGWTKAPGGDAASNVQWVATGGNPGGHLRFNEAAAGANDRIAAPTKFLGDKSAFIGGTFSMDRNTNTLSNPGSNLDDVTLIGSGISIRFDTPNPTVGSWSTTTVDLVHDAGWLRVSDGLPPTISEFSLIMGNLTAIYLDADFRSGPETPLFDNIRMTAIPEASMTPALVGLTALALLRRGRVSRGGACGQA